MKKWPNNNMDFLVLIMAGIAFGLSIFLGAVYFVNWIEEAHKF